MINYRDLFIVLGQSDHRHLTGDLTPLYMIFTYCEICHSKQVDCFKFQYFAKMRRKDLQTMHCSGVCIVTQTAGRFDQEIRTRTEM